MRPLTKWEKFKRRFIWGSWRWDTFIVNKRVIVIGKLKYKKRQE